MKKLIIAFSMLAASTAGAFAADLAARPYTKAPAPVAVYDWTGFYIGGQVGAVANSARFSCIDGPCDTGPYNPSLTQVLAGVYAGYNYQVNRFVFGIEGDINKNFGKGTFANSEWDAVTTGYVTSSTYNASIRGRAGLLATDKLLVYATGGVAFTNYKLDNPSCPDCAGWGSTTLISGSRTGYTVGAGLEYALDLNVHFKLEYLYSDYGSKTLTYDGVSFPSKLTTDQVRLGMSYKFGGPIVAAY